MLAPISARLASSCSRNGIRAVADRHHLARRDVHVVDLGDGTSTASSSPTYGHQGGRSVAKSVGVELRLAWAMTWRSSSSAVR